MVPLGDHIGCQKSNLGQLLARQALPAIQSLQPEKEFLNHLPTIFLICISFSSVMGNNFF